MVKKNYKVKINSTGKKMNKNEKEKRGERETQEMRAD